MQGRFANVPAYGDIEFPTWKDFSPRLSAIYDIAGDGKTAIRAGFNKFVTAQTTGFAQLYNPTALTTAVLPWTDVNGDDIAQGERGCAFLTAGCEINFANLPTNFGIRSLAQFDPDIKRPYSLAFNLGVTREVMPGLSVAAEYYRIDFQNITVRQNSLLNAEQLQPVQRGEPARRQRHPGVGHQAGVPRPGGQRRQHQRRDEAQLQRHRRQLQRPHAARHPRLRRLQPRALDQQHLCGGRERSRTSRSTATSPRAASRGRSSSRARSSIRRRGTASR